ncbi:hypothetical protein BHE74_00053573 [Ensete ventricosum]|nr:hypothetical protein BHE74_00053573 [Ensete ventricosum]RZS08220.1 hypothetical protein BHM03_00039161 [Ensete ventricosum]
MSAAAKDNTMAGDRGGKGGTLSGAVGVAQKATHRRNISVTEDATRLLQATAGGGVLAMRLAVEEDLVRSDRGFLSLGRRRADFESDNSEEKDRSQEVKKLLPLTEDTP